MNKWAVDLLFSVSFLGASFVYAQSADTSSSGSGVLISPPAQSAYSDQDQEVQIPNSSDQGSGDNPGHHKHHRDDDGNGGDSSSGAGQSSSGSS